MALQEITLYFLSSRFDEAVKAIQVDVVAGRHVAFTLLVSAFKEQGTMQESVFFNKSN